jgi:hypothetical protein
VLHLLVVAHTGRRRPALSLAARILPLGLLAAALLPACAPGDPAAAARQVVTDPPSASRTLPATTPLPTPSALRVAVRPYHEPGDHAHRNYCGAGATEVLLSAWMPGVPDVETVARGIALDPDTGATGAHTAAGIDAFLRPVVAPRLGHDRYLGEHITTLDGVLQRLRTDLGDARALHLFGHTVPVMVQTMTKTMPGWNGWQATHMITIAEAQLDSGNSDVDTVTYAETPSPIAGYNGPPFRTITVRALWTAMQAFLADDPADPINVIS